MPHTISDYPYSLQPFYGRSYLGSGITGKGQPFSGAADELTWSDDEGTPQYFNIAKKINGFTSVRDEETMTQMGKYFEFTWFVFSIIYIILKHVA